MHAVEPKCDVSVVLVDPHCGQATGGSVSKRPLAPAPLARVALKFGAKCTTDCPSAARAAAAALFGGAMP